MPGSLSLDSHRTLLTLDQNGPLGTIEILHPAGTFAPTPAALIAGEAIAEQRALLSGTGRDWGSGVGCLPIAAARLETVTHTRAHALPPAPPLPHHPATA